MQHNLVGALALIVVTIMQRSTEEEQNETYLKILGAIAAVSNLAYLFLHRKGMKKDFDRFVQ